MLETELISLYKEKFKIIKNIYNVFVSYYGEEYLEINGVDYTSFKGFIMSKEIGAICLNDCHNDLEKQSILWNDIKNDITTILRSYKCEIIVHRPKVTVTDEYDNFETIYDTFIQVMIDGTGCIMPNPKIRRTTFTDVQYIAGYTHSHAPIRTPIVDDFIKICLGGGPIIDTISTLSYKVSLDLWEIFCFELDVYIRTESQKGGPYFKLTSLTKNNCFSTPFCTDVSMYSLGYYTPFKDCSLELIEYFNTFLKEYFTHTKIPFSYNGVYILGMHYKDFLLDISNKFIDYTNNKKHIISVDLYKEIKQNLLESCTYKYGDFYYAETEIENYNTEKINMVFKGTLYDLKIIPTNNTNDKSYLLIKDKIINTVLVKILNIINYYEHDTHGNTIFL